MLDRTTSVYAWSVRVVLRVAVLGIIAFIGLILLGGYGFGQLPSGFVPQEDEGWCLVNVQLPDAASLERTEAVSAHVGEIAMATPGVREVINITGYSLMNGAASSNTASILAMFDDWEERTTPDVSQAAIIGSMNRQFQQIQEAMVAGFAMPSSRTRHPARLAMQIQDTGGLPGWAAGGHRQHHGRDGRTGAATNVFTGFRANVPQLYVDIDREQAAAKNVGLDAVFERCRPTSARPTSTTSPIWAAPSRSRRRPKAASATSPPTSRTSKCRAEPAR